MRVLIFIILLLECTLSLFGQTYKSKSHRTISTVDLGLLENDIECFMIDSIGNKWIGTKSSGLLKYESLGREAIPIENYAINGNCNGPLFIDSSDSLWVSTSNPNELYVHWDNSLSKVVDTEVEEIGNIIAISENSKGELFIAGVKGLVKYDRLNFYKVDLPVENVTIRTLDISSKDILGIGFNGGLILGEESNWKVYEENKRGLQLPMVKQLKFINDTTLIIAYDKDFFDVVFSVKKGDKWKHYRRSEVNKARLVIPLYSNGKKEVEVTINKIENRNDTFLMLTDTNNIFRFDGKKIVGGFMQSRGSKIRDIVFEGNTLWVIFNNEIRAWSK